jgi:hypothetical protein
MNHANVNANRMDLHLRTSLRYDPDGTRTTKTESQAELSVQTRDWIQRLFGLITDSKAALFALD